MANGKYGGLRFLKPLQGDLTNDLLNAEDQQFRYREEKRKDRQEQRLEEEITYQRLQDQRKKQEADGQKLKEKLDKAQIGSTGVKSHDEAVISILQGDGGIFDQINEIHEGLKKTPNDVKLLTKQSNLEKSIETIKKLQAGLLERGKVSATGVADGTLSPTLNKGFLEDYDKMVSEFQYNYKITDDGRIVVQNKGYDPEKDGMPNELSLEDLYDPTKMKGLVSLFKPGEIQKSLQEKYGTFEFSNEKGYETSTYKGFNPANEGLLKNDIDALFGSEFGDMTDAAKSFINDTLKGDYNGVTEKQFNAIKQTFADQVKARYDKKSGKDIDQVSKRLAEDNNKPEDKNKPAEFTPMVGTDGKPVNLKRSVRQNEKGFNIKEPKEVQIGDKNITVKSLYVDDKGYVVYSGTIKEKEPKIITKADGKDYKNPKEGQTIIKQYEGGGNNQEELNQLAVGLGYANANELKKALKGEKQTKGVVESKVDTSKMTAKEKIAYYRGLKTE